VILDQLQLDLEGVEPLSEEDRISRWLSKQTDESEDVFEAALFLHDHNSRGDRAARWFKVRQVRACPFACPNLPVLNLLVAWRGGGHRPSRWFTAPPA
jgi:hypothetical protein